MEKSSPENALMGFLVLAPPPRNVPRENAAIRDTRKAKFAFIQTAAVHSFVLLHRTT
jgi:hypothetical protein